MSRNQRLEDLCQALYDLDQCAADARGEVSRHLDSLIRQACVLGGCTRDELMGAIASIYREYRRDRRRNERLIVAQAATRLQ